MHARVETTRQSIEASRCFGLFDPQGCQAGFARVVTDFATFGWLCDGFVLESFRGKGLGTRLVRTVVDSADLRDLKRLLLAARDAHELCRRHGGFTPLPSPERRMERVRQPS